MAARVEQTPFGIQNKESTAGSIRETRRVTEDVKRIIREFGDEDYRDPYADAATDFPTIPQELQPGREVIIRQELRAMTYDPAVSELPVYAIQPPVIREHISRQRFVPRNDGMTPSERRSAVYQTPSNN